MYLPQSPNDTYESNDFYKKSFYSNLKRQLTDDEQPIKSEISSNIPRKLPHKSSTTDMYQATTNSQNDESAIGVPSRFCSVCGDISTGIHFGGNSCESCKAFFRRSVQCNRYQNYKCSNEEHCPVNLVTRKVCQFCRYTKCTTIGMKPKWVLSDQEREEKYGSRRKRCRQNPISEEDPEIYKYLTKEEKALVEDIAHALYQSRATYPLEFPSKLNQYLKLLSAGVPSPIPSPLSTTEEKPANPSANFLIIPIRRFVLFARMLKDFEIFSEDDKVNLLKSSAIEIIVWSSNTLFDSKTRTFTNYISRDQRAAMDEQVIPLDPLLKKLWGEDLFIRTTQFLIGMCNLYIDEVASTLLVPVLLFSPDRCNIEDVQSVQRLQIKYVTLLRKYMLWRYGKDKTENVYPKLLLQIINIRTLGLSHAEIIQKVMTTSSVDPLVKEVTAKPDTDASSSTTTTKTERLNSVSTDSTTNDSQMDSMKTPSTDTESVIGSDEEEINRKKSRPSIDEDEDFDETNLANIWRKRRKYSNINQTEIQNHEERKSSFDHTQNLKQGYSRSNSMDCEQQQQFSSNSLQRKPHDHQVPNFISTCQDDLMLNYRASNFRHLPPKKKTLLINREDLHGEVYPGHSMSVNDASSYNPYLHSNSNTNSPLTTQFYEHYRPGLSPMSPSTFQQHQNEQHLRQLSLEANQSSSPSSIQSPSQPQSHALSMLKPDEQQLLDAIHCHPNKQDLVLNLLRQMNESSLPNHLQQQQQRRRPDTTNNSNSYRQ